ncbi:phosphatidylglycerol lysyltransferase domain-containing protein [Jeotgalibacillus proteolyticus]|uniref:Phosphatidylglycerol lysyltransferase C-terminal domain-containing protein n=1 Tax=Jeotgalibacillus proteolyticus TaxID=2082395 RepID=A0A2S5G7M3_9BACL|nr:phosphatidylglycerol lysyltransferase domain-containing protein [Jeotgalibacillus proteolyticus]PPA68955.1 hypothetical protein C4B60_18770 [Jeotgalibacillus proteolyticus]
MKTDSREVILGKWKFYRITIQDKSLYANYIQKTQYPTDLWSSNFDYLWAASQPDSELVLWKVVRGMLVTFKLTRRNILQIAFLPFGYGDADKVTEVLLKCLKFCHQWNNGKQGKTRVRAISKKQLSFIQTSSLFNQNFRFAKLNGRDRHISVNKVIQLHGKEFKEVRQKINRFLRNYPDTVVRKAKPSDYRTLVNFKDSWNRTSGSKYSKIWDDQAYRKIMKNNQKLEHIVLVAETKGEVVGVVTGGILPHGQAWSAFLKSLKGYDGLSEFLNVEFAREIFNMNPGVEMINIGSDYSDNGGLQKFKDKFRPVLNAKRYRLYLK